MCFTVCSTAYKALYLAIKVLKVVTFSQSRVRAESSSKSNFGSLTCPFVCKRADTVVIGGDLVIVRDRIKVLNSAVIGFVAQRERKRKVVRDMKINYGLEYYLLIYSFELL